MKIESISSWPFIPSEAPGPIVIAGPCSAETPEQLHSVAGDLSAQGKIHAFRAGIWKPRTRPNNFEGIGAIALKWLREVKEEFNLPLCIEVATPEHVELALKHDVDILWVGARTTVNPFSVQSLADSLKGVNIPIFVKNPINADLALWIGALERLNQAGITRLAAIHRGFSRFEKGPYRNPPLWQIPIELKRRFPELPLFCDPSHIAGKRDGVAKVCQKAMDLRMDGLMVETHPEPEHAWSDAEQQVTPIQLKSIIENLCLRGLAPTGSAFEEALEGLRTQIDRIDREIIEALGHRKTIGEKIAQLKYENQVTPLQINRMDQLMATRAAWGEEMRLGPQFINQLFETIHEESIRTQTNYMREQEEKKK